MFRSVSIARREDIKNSHTQKVPLRFSDVHSWVEASEADPCAYCIGSVSFISPTSEGSWRSRQVGFSASRCRRSFNSLSTMDNQTSLNLDELDINRSGKRAAQILHWQVLGGWRNALGKFESIFKLRFDACRSCWSYTRHIRLICPRQMKSTDVLPSERIERRKTTRSPRDSQCKAWRCSLTGESRFHENDGEIANQWMMRVATRARDKVRQRRNVSKWLSAPPVLISFQF